MKISKLFAEEVRKFNYDEDVRKLVAEEVKYGYTLFDRMLEEWVPKA